MVSAQKQCTNNDVYTNQNKAIANFWEHHPETSLSGCVAVGVDELLSCDGVAVDVDELSSCGGVAVDVDERSSCGGVDDAVVAEVGCWRHSDISHSLSESDSSFVCVGLGTSSLRQLQTRFVPEMNFRFFSMGEGFNLNGWRQHRHGLINHHS